ncbi:MAG: hypothetical protein AB8G23_16190 [Myxococcota bacterium]
MTMSQSLHVPSMSFLKGSICLSALAVALVIPGFVQAEPPVLSVFQGDWERADSPEAEKERISSIDRAIGDLSWVVRKMAGGVLRSSTKPPSEVHFEWDGAALHQLVDGDQGSFSRPVEIGAEPMEAVDERGDPFTSSWEIGDGGLALSWEQHQAYGTNLYRVAEGGRLLEVEHTINVTALSGVAPIVYYSRFRRGSEAASASPQTLNSSAAASRPSVPSVAAGPLGGRSGAP